MHRTLKLAAVLIAMTTSGVLAQTAPSTTPPPAAAPAPAAAQPSPRDAIVAKYREACAADVQKFCATAEKGRGKMRACLDGHATELSASCQTARAERAALKK